MTIEVYAAPGYGSAIAEGILALADIPFTRIDVRGFEDESSAKTTLAAVNPLCQLPTIVLPDGQVLTESAAIALYIADRHPGLAPRVDDPERARFLRLLVWIAANIYPSFTYGDAPGRWVQTAPEELRETTDAHRETLYRWLETQVSTPFALGAQPGVLDIFIAAMTNWRPGRAWFAAQTPGLAAIGERTRALPALADVRRFNAWGN